MNFSHDRTSRKPQLRGLKAEVKDHFKASKKLEENQERDSARALLGSFRFAFQRVYGLNTHSRTSGESSHHHHSVSDIRVPRATRTAALEALREFVLAVKKDKVERSVLVAELKKISSCLEASVPKAAVASTINLNVTPPFVCCRGADNASKGDSLTPSIVGVEARQILPAVFAAVSIGSKTHAPTKSMFSQLAFSLLVPD